MLHSCRNSRPFEGSWKRLQSTQSPSYCLCCEIPMGLCVTLQRNNRIQEQEIVRRWRSDDFNRYIYFITTLAIISYVTLLQHLLCSILIHACLHTSTVVVASYMQKNSFAHCQHVSYYNNRKILWSRVA